MRNLRSIDQVCGAVLIWIMRLALVAIIISIVVLLQPSRGSLPPGALVAALVASLGLAGSLIRRQYGMWLFLASFLTTMLCIWLAVDLIVLRGVWWEWPIAAVIQMGLPIIAVWYGLSSPRFREYF